MAEQPDETKTVQFLLTNLIILAIFILALVFFSAAYPTLLAPDPTATPTQTLPSPPSLTPSHTPTITPTPEPTNTPRPTLTPTPTATSTRALPPAATPTPPGPPTLTPAVPVIGEGLYALSPWSPELAERLIALIEDYPNTLTAGGRTLDAKAQMAAHQYAVLALREALLRFPDVSQAESWRWRLAYALARSGDPQAGETYAALIGDAVNRADTTLERLPEWFLEHEPRLTLYGAEVDPPEGALRSFLLQVQGMGGAAIWLVQTTSGYQAYMLTSDFNLATRSGSGAVVADLNGDARPEAAIFPLSATATQLLPPRVFDLGQTPPQELPFLSGSAQFELGMTYTNNWIVRPSPAEKNRLVFSGQMFPACPLTVERAYEWQETAFGLVEQTFSLQTDPLTLAFCRLVVEHTALVWGPEASIPILETLLPDWPPAFDETGQPFDSAGAKDELRFRLAMQVALAGKFDTAQRQFQELAAQPDDPSAAWSTAAQDFLNVYTQPAEIYRACVQAPLCRPDLAIQALFAEQQPGDVSSAWLMLWQAGVGLRASGFYDFDGDGVTERWFTVRHRPLEKLEYWILANTTQGAAAVRVGIVYADKPFLEPAPGSEDDPVFWLDEDLAFQFRREPLAQRPYLVFTERRITFPNRFLEGQQAAEAALLSGADPRQVRQDLLNLEDFPGLLCRGDWSCDRYYYLRGLAAELAGMEPQAVADYMFLWLNYSRSPFTTMARLKLEGSAVVAPSATPSGPTASPTITPTLDPNVTPTPGAPESRPTETGEPYPTPDPGAEPTFEPYPTP